MLKIMYIKENTDWKKKSVKKIATKHYNLATTILG